MSNSLTGRYVTFTGERMALEGHPLYVGDPAPDFTLIDGSLRSVSLRQMLGRVLLLATVPSLDTEVCSLETRRFDREVVKFGTQISYVTVSMDLPFAQRRWRSETSVEQVDILSDYKERRFATDYGLYIPDLGLLARAVLVLDKAGIVRYQEIVPEVTDEPNYAAALEMAQRLLSSD